jgi:two-component system, cell cycle response regulator
VPQVQMRAMAQAALRRDALSVAGADARAIRVLLVEDNPGDARLISIALGESVGCAFRVTVVDSLTVAALSLGSARYDAIVLDLSLPDSSGLDGLKELALAAPHTPIVVLTGFDNDELAVDACRHGAQDYLVKGDTSFSLLARTVRCAMERKAFEVLLAERVYSDALTGLVNRRLFLDRLAHCVMQAKRSPGKQAAVVFIDLDDFKRVNDLQGHLAGDQILRAVANALRTAVRQTDTVARMGGDEFTVLLDPIDDAADVAPIAQKLMRGLLAAGGVLRQRTPVTASLGVALFPTHAEDVEGLLLHADQAMYAAKRAGGNAVRFAGVT